MTIDNGVQLAAHLRERGASVSVSADGNLITASYGDMAIAAAFSPNTGRLIAGTFAKEGTADVVDSVEGLIAALDLPF